MNQDAILDNAARVIRSGGIVIVPTETFYALAADPFREESVRRIFEIKSRPEEKPLPLIAADREAVERVVMTPPDTALRLMAHFWPGSLTILLKPAVSLSRLVTGPDGRIGVRVPPPCAARTVAERAGGWITATSANLSDDPNPDEVHRIVGTVRDAADLVVDLGRSPGGQPSTVVEPLANGFRIVRVGAVPESALRRVLSMPHPRESS